MHFNLGVLLVGLVEKMLFLDNLKFLSHQIPIAKPLGVLAITNMYKLTNKT